MDSKQKRTRKHGMYKYGPFGVREDEYVTGAGFLCLVRKGNERVNLVMTIYENGRYPYFPKNKKIAAYLVTIPKPVILDLALRIKRHGQRIRKRKEHKWKVRYYKLEEADKIESETNIKQEKAIEQEGHSSS